jgi:preprotein translocase subunit SecD
MRLLFSCAILAVIERAKMIVGESNHGSAREARRQMKLRLTLGVLACALLLSLAGCGATSAPGRTLQRDGGARITLHAVCFPDNANCDVNARMNSAMGVLARRASAAGYHDVAVRVGGEAQTVVVEAPGVGDGKQLLPLLTSRGQLFFIDTGGKALAVGEDATDNICESRCTPGKYTVLFRGEDLDLSQVRASIDQTTGQPVVAFAFKGDAQKRFAVYTSSHIAQYLTITLDGKVIESAVIQSQITGPGQISAALTMAEATALAAQLTSGELPLKVTVVNVEQVTPAAK